MSNDMIITAEPNTPFLDNERVFDATPRQLFRAMTEADLVKQWLGPANLKMVIDHYDAHDGGSYRYVHSDENGEYAFRGTFHTVRPDELIIQTFEFEGWPDTVTIETMRLEDLGDGRTKAIGHTVFPSVEARDGALQSNMAEGMTESYDRLAKLAVTV